jgi:multiple antibiotic resistance protein
MIEKFLLAFIPLFVAIDVFGVLPLYVGLVQPVDEPKRKHIPLEAVTAAFTISLIFLFSGKLIFSFLGITENDFRVGGGIILLVLAIQDLVFTRQESRTPESSFGVVPLGIPLVMGPAGLTTIIILVDSYGYILTIISLIVNMIVVYLVFHQADRINHAMGKAGSKAAGKVAALFLAGIAVMMIRSGIQAMIGQ